MISYADFNINPQLNDRLATLSELSVGQELRGRVANVASFGAFIDCGLDKSVMLHESEYRGTSPEVGHCLLVVVKSIELARGRCGVGLKQ